MEEETKKIKYNSSGSSRQRRFLPSLDPGYFKIDDRTLADFLVFIEKYADYVYAYRYPVDSENPSRKTATWRPFFYSDLSVFLAKLSFIDHTGLIPFYLKEDLAGGEESQRVILQSRMKYIMELIAMITDSYYPILDVHREDPSVKQLIDYIEQIRNTNLFQEIIRLTRLLDLDVQNNVIIHPNYEAIWGTSFHITGKLDDQKEVENAIKELNKTINNFLVIAGQLVHYSKSLFLESVTTNQYHNPGTALFIAFLKLYTFLQEDLNKITEKHLDYFYKELLQQKIKPSSPDYVHVCFALSDHVDFCEIEKGTFFKAGIDEEGYDLLYTSTDHLTVNETKVTDLCAFYLSEKEEVGVENAYKFVSDIYQSNIISSNGGFDLSYDPVSFSLFEKNKANPDYKEIKSSELGFAIASPLLLLSEGKRECNLILNFNIKSMSTLLTFLERYTINETLTFDKAFHKLFYRTFSISLTTEEGWYQLEDYKLYSPDSISGSFKISFVLPMGAPPIIGMGEKWDKNECALYNTEWPVLKLSLSNQRSMLMYSYLRDLIITECSIQVAVTGMKNLQVFNDLGELDISTPFYPFGSLPVLGSSFLIGSEELYKKRIEDFSFEFIWYNLPRTKGGFSSYYKEYDPAIDNDSFKVGVTALSDYEFHPVSQDEVQQFSLFSATEEQEGQLPVLDTISRLRGFDINKLKINADYSNVVFPPYNNKTKSGYIKLELLSPEMSFGQNLYPTLFSTKIVKGIKSSGAVDLPNPPYIPQLKSITLNYKASTTIDFQVTSFMKSDPKANEKVYLLHPFGIQTIFKNNTVLSDKFLPQFFHNGYIALGLDTVDLNEPLTIYFVLDPSIGNEFEVELPKVDWYYIFNDKWIQFDKKALVFDTTQNFTTTGIVKLWIPKIMDNQSNIFPKGKYWIVAAIKGNIELVAKIKGVYTQALKLIWSPHKENAWWSQPIPENTIETLVIPKPEIASIFQPLPSFGGSDKETATGFYTRVSERLQHRNRCVTAWDYERMVLERFPFVNQVKCITPVKEGGNVILIVVPQSRVAYDFILPRFNYSVLQEIKEYVEKYTAPFVRLQVINPVYEEVKISASIKFRDEIQKGTGVENIHRDLRTFICPWYADATREMEFGGSVNLDELEAFIRSRPYIGFVTNLSVLILHYHDKNYTLSDSAATSVLDKTLCASKPWVVLIPMQHHLISIIETDVYISPGQAAVENLRIGNEFVLGDKPGEKKGKKEVDTPMTDTGKYITIDIDI